ncbi:MAG: hypothetical protein LBB22_02070 [Treponema sp.]|nr:hypothetical protein [Treponema sp.]
MVQQELPTSVYIPNMPEAVAEVLQVSANRWYRLAENGLPTKAAQSRFTR